MYAIKCFQPSWGSVAFLGGRPGRPWPYWVGPGRFDEAMEFYTVAAAEKWALDRLVGPNLSGELSAVDTGTREEFPICRGSTPNPTHAAALTLLIGSKSYRVKVDRPGRHADGSLRSLVELSYADKSYHVATVDNRHVHPRFLHHQCDCGDYTFRREDDPRACKHIRSLIEVGLLEPVQ